MVRVFVFLAAVQLVLVVLALISCLSAERVRTMPRLVWVLVILLIPLLGPAAYFIAGRPARAGGTSRPGSRRRAANPDDDPEFLRSLNAEQARRDRELLAQWEGDLHGRPDEPPARSDDKTERAAEPKSREDEPRRRDNEETPPTEV